MSVPWRQACRGEASNGSILHGRCWKPFVGPPAAASRPVDNSQAWMGTACTCSPVALRPFADVRPLCP